MGHACSGIRGLVAAVLCGALLLNGPVLYALQEEENFGAIVRDVYSAVQAAVAAGMVPGEVLLTMEDWTNLAAAYREETDSSKRQEYARQLRNGLAFLSSEGEAGYARQIELLRERGDPRAQELADLADDAEQRCGTLMSEEFRREQEAQIDRYEDGGPLPAGAVLEAGADCLASGELFRSRLYRVLAELRDSVTAMNQAIDDHEQQCANATGEEKTACEKETDRMRTELKELEETLDVVEETERRERQKSGGGNRCGFLNPLCIIMAGIGLPFLVLGGPEAYADYLDATGLTESKGVEYTDDPTGERVAVREFTSADRQEAGADFVDDLALQGYDEVPYRGVPDGRLAIHFRQKDGELLVFMGEVLRAKIFWDCNSDESDANNIEVLQNGLGVRCMDELRNLRFAGPVVDESDVVRTAGGEHPRNRFAFKGTATHSGAAVEVTITERRLGVPSYVLTVEQAR